MRDSWQRISILQWETMKEILHNPWFHVCVGGLLSFVVGGRLLTDLPLGAAAPKLIYDFGQGIILAVAGTVLVLLLAYQISNDLQTRVVYGYLVRRVTLTDYLFGKLWGSWLALILVVLVADGLLMLLLQLEADELHVSGIEFRSPELLGWLQLFFLQSLHLLVLSGLTIFMVSLSNSFLFSALTTLAVWGMGLFLGGISETGFTGAGGFFLDAFRWVVPRFSSWNYSGEIWYRGSMEFPELVQSFILALLYGGLSMAAAIGIFSRRDL